MISLNPGFKVVVAPSRLISVRECMAWPPWFLGFEG